MDEHDDEGKVVPRAFVCPITAEVMIEPVVCADGHTYEKAAIENWLGRGRTTSPLTNAELPRPHTLLPNYALRSAIVEWREAQPLAIDPDRLDVREHEHLGVGSFGVVVAGTLQPIGAGGDGAGGAGSTAAGGGFGAARECAPGN